VDKITHAAMMAFAECAEQRRAEQHPDKARAQHRAGGGPARNIPRFHQFPYGKAKRGNVVAVNQHDEEGENDQADVEAGDPTHARR
jgi:hypothetical protein